jgi:hypothetical protein
MQSSAFGERLIALFLFGALAFSPALLHVFRSDALVLGVPAFYLYLFAAWAALIGLAALVVERGGGERARGD